MAKITYSVLTYSATRRGALVDRGANGGIAGEDVRIIAKTGRQVDIQGIDNHCINDIPIVTAGGVVNTQKGEVIAIMHQYAYVGKGKSIHSCGQLEAHKQTVHDKSIKVGGKQRIETLAGYIIPLNIRQGLPFMTIRPYTDAEWEQLPHVILTADTDWDPSILDCEQEDNEEWFNAMEEIPTLTPDPMFDEYGDYRNIHTIAEVVMTDPVVENAVLTDLPNLLQLYSQEIKPRKVNVERYQPKLAWLPLDIIQRTFESTTQFYRTPMSTHLKKRYKSPFPACNVIRRDEPVATDTVYADTPAIGNGATTAQFFVGTKSLVCDVYPMKTDKQFVNVLLDNIRCRRAMTKLISDRAQCKAESDIWMRRNGELYEYIAVYVDDLAFAMKNPSHFVDTLKTKYGFKIREAGPLKFHLGADFFRDEEGILCMAPQKYIERLISSYEQMFGMKPSLKVHSPLEKGDHTELDNSELLDKHGIEQYQSLLEIGRAHV